MNIRFGGITHGDFLTLLVLVFIFFGANRLPEVGRKLSDAMRENRKKDVSEEVVEEGKESL